MGKYVDDVLKKLGIAVVQSMKNTLSKNRKLNTGRLYNSLFYVVDSQEQSVTISCIGYGKFVDSGRRAGATPPPYKVILEWFRGKNGRSFLTKNKIKPANYKGAAIGVAKSIGKKGIQPVKFLNRQEKVFNIKHYNYPNFKSELAQAITKEIMGSTGNVSNPVKVSLK